MSMKYFSIQTYGCQMNEHDSERMAGILLHNGLLPTATPEAADIILFNTCSVREHAEQRVCSNLGRLKFLKRRRPDLILGLCGCVAQAKKEHLFTQFPYLDLVVGPRSIPHLWEIVTEVRQSRRQVLLAELDESGMNTPVEHTDRQSTVKSWVTIMEGCNNFCSYCIVPFVRGRERSRPIADIVREVQWLAQNGYKEVDLLGQNVNSFGVGSDGESFPMLLRTLNEIKGLRRIRFFTSHPKDASDDLIAAMATCEKVCPQFHLPVQSGSDRILKLMNRRYTRQHYLNIIEKLRKAIPEIAISTDIIVGFPSETEKDYEETLSLLEEIGYDSLYAFHYSPREFTKAAQLADDVPKEEKLRRLNHLLKLQRPISMAANEAMVGTKVEVLVDGVSKRDKAHLQGRTPGNKVVNFVSPKAANGDLVEVKIIEAHQNSLVGEVCEKD